MVSEKKHDNGFTLIELLIVLSVLAVLLAIAVPTYQRHLIKAREAALSEDLFQMRDALDKHFADTGKYPAALGELVSKKYLRKVPEDPFTKSTDTWVTVDSDTSEGISDVRSGSDGEGLNGVPYSEW
ncbi:MAG: prepilin-type N-terminal cleavage/methylation domain-containing protein [Deltaproteobacteria bacterium]|nr:prepilin-type N-terminal cleavage/methylation domain-containing protein [Deltaproteobacteria bacterium]